MRYSVREIALIALLSSLNISSRWALMFMPNVKPVLATIVVMTLVTKPSIGMMIGLVTFIVSALSLGMGTWVPFQCLAVVVISLVTFILKKLNIKHRYIIVVMSVLSAILFGLIMSLETLLLAGPQASIIYWLNGLVWDFYSVIGNVIFTPVLYSLISRLYPKYKR